MLSYERRHLSYRTGFHKRPSRRLTAFAPGVCAMLLLSDPGTQVDSFLLLSDPGTNTDVLQLLNC